MHTFGHPWRIDEIVDICTDLGIPLVEEPLNHWAAFTKGVIRALLAFWVVQLQWQLDRPPTARVG